MKNIELAKKFLYKAEEDITLLNAIINNNDISDEIFGFHCQQSAEKILKAVLIYFEINFRRTHDLRELLDILYDNSICVPNELNNLDVLTPFAVEYRYDFYDEPAKLNRCSMLELILKLKKWAEKIVF